MCGSPGLSVGSRKHVLRGVLDDRRGRGGSVLVRGDRVDVVSLALFCSNIPFCDELRICSLDGDETHSLMLGEGAFGGELGVGGEGAGFDIVANTVIQVAIEGFFITLFKVVRQHGELAYRMRASRIIDVRGGLDMDWS